MAKHKTNAPAFRYGQEYGNEITDWSDRRKLVAALLQRRAEILKSDRIPVWGTTMHLAELFMAADEFAYRHWYDWLIERMADEVWNVIFTRDGSDRRADAAA